MIMVELTSQENAIRVSVQKVERNNLIAALVRCQRRPVSGGVAGMVAGTNENPRTAYLVGHREKI